MNEFIDLSFGYIAISGSVCSGIPGDPDNTGVIHWLEFWEWIVKSSISPQFNRQS